MRRLLIPLALVPAGAAFVFLGLHLVFRGAVRVFRYLADECKEIVFGLVMVIDLVLLPKPRNPH